MTEVSIREAFAKCFPLIELDCNLADRQKSHKKRPAAYVKMPCRSRLGKNR